MIHDYKDIKVGADIQIDTNKQIIVLSSNMTDAALYTFLKNIWMEHPNYIKFYFPMTSFVDVFGKPHISMANDWQLIGIHKLTETKK
jgi:hypothetical protein